MYILYIHTVYTYCIYIHTVYTYCIYTCTIYTHVHVHSYTNTLRSITIIFKANKQPPYYYIGNYTCTHIVSFSTLQI